MSDSVELKIEDKVYKLPVIEGTEGEKALDISDLRDESGYITLDLGYKNTGSTISKVTFLDGENGILRYRGYPIEELAERSSFLEVAYLIIYGVLPKKNVLEKFTTDVKKEMLVSKDINNILESFPSHAHPMGVLSSVVCALTAFHPESLDPSRAVDVQHSILKLMGSIPTIAAWSYRKEVGLPLTYPETKNSYSGNFLKMMFSLPTEEYEVDPVVEEAFDKLLILHADHEQNCSTSTVRIVGSSQASIYASISAGICALWGPLHGGANQAVINMLENIKKDGGDSRKYIEKAKDKNDPFRLMGFGHRVYKSFDPRANIIKRSADQILERLGVEDPVLDIARMLEETALKDEYFIERKLYPNVDFYSGIIFRAIGIPLEMFPVMFSIGRLPGWIANWMEMRENKEPIGRPRQIYTGENKKRYVKIEDREPMAVKV